jgi:hypothetical protein
MADGAFSNAWKPIDASTNSGEFKLHPDAFVALRKHLLDHDGKLQQAARAVAQIEHVSGIGAFPRSGQAIEGKFTMKANGAADSLTQRIEDHHQHVVAMINTLSKMVDNFTGVDDYVRKNIDHAAAGD